MNRPATLSYAEAARVPPRASNNLHELFGQGPGFVLQLDLDGHVLASSLAATVAPHTTLAEHCRLIATAEFDARLQGVIDRREPLQIEVQALREDGTRAWYLLGIGPVRRGATVLGLAVHGLDISDRKREEERLRRSEAMMVDTQGVAHLGIWEWDVTQPHAVWSPELYRIYGLPGSHLPTYDDYLTRVHPDDRQRVIDATNGAFHDHKPYSHDERIYRADGSLCHLHTWAFPVLDDHGTLIRLTGVCQDITDRKLAENAVVEHAAELARTNAELEQFARVAAHDLQEPLRTVSSFVQLLTYRLEGKLDASAQEAVGFIVQGVHRMKALISDLLKYSRVAGQPAPRKPTSLTESLERVQDELAVALAESGARIRCGPLPLVLSDLAQADSLLRNLLDNAIKFRGSESPQIEISAERVDRMVEVVVRDNGIGIAPRHHDRIFVVFQRLNPDTQGTGIGLAVCKKIVEHHGGRIWVESDAGGGAAFHFTLPAATGG